MQTIIQSHYTLPLDSSDSTLELVGGKGCSLAQLAALNLSVPAGFHVTTLAYRQFVSVNGLQSQIEQIINQMGQGTMTAAQAAIAIQALFAAGEMPADIADMLRNAYGELGEVPVAVRSSATAEDLPEMSFAGQQDSFLNVVGMEGVETAVIDCWASLWTARAISYRQRMGIDHRAVAMGVVVQKMVPADLSGILFTANPTTGNRNEMVINASYGLGEAIVGGHITPDTYVVDSTSGAIQESTIGSKETMIVSANGQGVETQAVSDEQRQASALSVEKMQALIAVSKTIDKHFGMPQDIEWAVANDTLWILQSRPITNLPPAPLTDVKWEYPGRKLIRRQVVEHMPDPLSPLFDDLYLSVGMDESMDIFLSEFGVDFDLSLLVHRPFFVSVNGYAYSGADFKISLKGLAKAIRVYVQVIKIFGTIIPRWRDDKMPAYMAVVDEWKALDIKTATDQQLWEGMRQLTIADAVYWFEVSIILGMSKVSDNFLHSFLIKQGEERGLTSGQFLRGFPSKTLAAQVDLETVAQQLRASEELRRVVAETAVSDLLPTLQKMPEAADAMQGIQAYFDKYGHQIYTLDFAEPTQGEDWLPVLLTLKALVQNPTDSTKRQTELAQERDSLATETAQSFRPFKRWRFRKLLNWAQKYGPYREEALFYIGAAWPTLRRFAHELGRRWVDADLLQNPDDIYFLRIDEVETIIAARAKGQALSDFKQLTRERRMLREARKRLDPPAKVPDIPFKIGPFDMSILETQKESVAEGDDLKGFAVSPGMVTAPASIILSPADFEKMQPGTILVCPTTTPAWTPLFSQAKGLVTEIGGILAHGSIVAREYGIPAVMGLKNITERIKDGQLITVDGNTGMVTIIGET